MQKGRLSNARHHRLSIGTGPVQPICAKLTATSDRNSRGGYSGGTLMRKLLSVLAVTALLTKWPGALGAIKG
jgi:hypothetical protein